MKQIIFLIIGTALFAQSVQAEDSCQSVRFSGEARGREAFRQVIGAEVSFFVDPSGGLLEAAGASKLALIRQDKSKGMGTSAW